MKTITIDGVNIYPFSSSGELIDYIDNNNKILVAINAEKVLCSTSQTRELINNNVGYCDGICIVLALKQKGAKNVVKIPGCELWLDIVKHYEGKKSFYLVGAKQEVIEATVTKLIAQFPKLDIVGYRNGYINSKEDHDSLIEDIKLKKPDVVFVAMGSPKQELLMGEMQQYHPAIYQGLGGSFDVYSGNANRAPKWWIDHNMEFVYRVLKEPRRVKRLKPHFKMAFRLLFRRV